MKKTTLTLAVILTLSCCAAQNQSQNSLSSVLSENDKKIKHAEIDIKPTNEMKTTTEAKQVKDLKQVEEDKQSPASQESATKEVSTLNTEPTKNLGAVTETPPASAKLIQAGPSAPRKIDVVTELKMARVPENVSIKALNNHHWQINKIFITNNFKANEGHWLFSFNQNGQYKAFGACNFLSGKFKATDEGAFRLGKLETSLNNCPESKEEEVMVFNMLLMADNFALRDEVLLFKSGDKVLTELTPSNHKINVNMSKKSHGKKEMKSKNIKSSQRKVTKPKAGKKSVKAKTPRDKKLKAYKSSASRSHQSSSYKKDLEKATALQIKLTVLDEALLNTISRREELESKKAG